MMPSRPLPTSALVKAYRGQPTKHVPFNVRNAIAVVRAQPFLIRDRLCAGSPLANPPCCAIGALLLAAGVSPTALVMLGGERHRWPQWVFTILYGVYGITPTMADEIIDANDGVNMDRRTNAVCSVIAHLVADSTEPVAQAGRGHAQH